MAVCNCDPCSVLGLVSVLGWLVLGGFKALSSGFRLWVYVAGFLRVGLRSTWAGFIGLVSRRIETLVKNLLDWCSFFFWEGGYIGLV